MVCKMQSLDLFAKTIEIPDLFFQRGFETVFSSNYFSIFKKGFFSWSYRIVGVLILDGSSSNADYNSRWVLQVRNRKYEKDMREAAEQLKRNYGREIVLRSESNQ